MARGQLTFSLAALFAVVTLCGLVLGMVRLIPVPDFRAVDSTVWAGFAMVATMTGLAIAGVRWLNS